MPGKRYVESEFNKVIIIPEREKYRVKLFMDAINQNEKTLVFCATQEHALAGARSHQPNEEEQRPALLRAGDGR